MIDLWKPVTIEHDGRRLTMKIRPLKRKHLPLMSKFFDLGKAVQDKGEAELRADPSIVEMTYAIQGAAKEALDECVKDMKFEDGSEPPSTEDLTDELIYTPLTMQIVTELVLLSSLKGHDIKNFGEPSVPTRTDGS